MKEFLQKKQEQWEIEFITFWNDYLCFDKNKNVFFEMLFNGNKWRQNDLEREQVLKIKVFYPDALKIHNFINEYY